MTHTIYKKIQILHNRRIFNDNNYSGEEIYVVGQRCTHCVQQHSYQFILYISRF